MKRERDDDMERDEEPRKEPQQTHHAFRMGVRPTPHRPPCEAMPKSDIERICIGNIFYTGAGVLVIVLGHVEGVEFNVAWAGYEAGTAFAASGMFQCSALEFKARCEIANVHQAESHELLFHLRQALGIDSPVRPMSRADHLDAILHEYYHKNPGVPMCWDARYREEDQDMMDL